jgi:hypothetical protein
MCLGDTHRALSNYLQWSSLTICFDHPASCRGAEEVSPVEGARSHIMRSASILAEPHPLIKGAVLIIVCTSGGFVSAWELTDTRQVVECA